MIKNNLFDFDILLLCLFSVCQILFAKKNFFCYIAIMLHTRLPQIVTVKHRQLLTNYLRISKIMISWFPPTRGHFFSTEYLEQTFYSYKTYMVFIKYCVFFPKISKIIRTLAFHCFPSVSVRVHTPGR